MNLLFSTLSIVSAFTSSLQTKDTTSTISPQSCTHFNTIPPQRPQLPPIESLKPLQKQMSVNLTFFDTSNGSSIPNVWHSTK